jgi:hypothetical protein
MPICTVSLIFQKKIKQEPLHVFKLIKLALPFLHLFVLSKFNFIYLVCMESHLQWDKSTYQDTNGRKENL